MSLPLHAEIWERDGGRCRICQIHACESNNNHVVRVMPDTPIHWETATADEWWVLCADDDVEIRAFLNGGATKSGIIKKYLRERSKLVAEIDARRKETANTRRPRRNP